MRNFEELRDSGYIEELIEGNLEEATLEESTPEVYAYRCVFDGFEGNAEEITDHFNLKHEELALTREELNEIKKEQAQRIETWKDQLEREILDNASFSELEAYRKNPDALTLAVHRKILEKGLEATKDQLSSLDTGILGSIMLPFKGQMVEGYSLCEIDGVKRLVRSDILNTIVQEKKRIEEHPEHGNFTTVTRQTVPLPENEPLPKEQKQHWRNPSSGEWQSPEEEGYRASEEPFIEQGKVMYRDYGKDVHPSEYYRSKGEEESKKKPYAYGDEYAPEYEYVEKSKNGFSCNFENCGKSFVKIQDCLKHIRQHLKKKYPSEYEEESLSSQSESAVDKLKKALEKN
jgi:hypothetical protein